MPDRKRYAIVGTGGRSRMFTDAICKDFADHAQLVAFCDTSQVRMDYWNQYVADTYGTDKLPTYKADKFDDMVKKAKPDVVIVTSVDATHHQYIIRAMELGCDAVSEKPMTTDEHKVAAIFDAIERTGQTLRVAFNYRWQTTFSKVKEVILSGAIGTPTLVDFQWRLDTRHGADYFRRWHREKQHSGGLLVHKSTHHFDLVNWLLDDHPETVFAAGGLMFYGEDNAKRRGVDAPYERYTGVPEAKDDPFGLFMDTTMSPNGVSKGNEMKALYLDAEAESGYIRDRNVFGGENKWPVTSEDTVSLSARFTKGAALSYSLIAYCPWEGERLCVNGTEGQVEYFGRGSGHIIAGQSDEELTKDQYQGEQYIRLQRMFEAPQELEVPKATGGHGGGDSRLLTRIFIPDSPPDEMGRDASHIDGAASVLTGVAANQSIATGQAVKLASLWPKVKQTAGA